MINIASSELQLSILMQYQIKIKYLQEKRAQISSKLYKKADDGPFFFQELDAIVFILICVEKKAFCLYISELLFVGGREGKREGEGERENQPLEGGYGLQCNC